MKVKLFFVTFNLNCGLHAVSVRKPSARMLNFLTVRIRFGYFISESKLNFGYLHTVAIRWLLLLYYYTNLCIPLPLWYYLYRGATFPRSRDRFRSLQFANRTPPSSGFAAGWPWPIAPEAARPTPRPVPVTTWCKSFFHPHSQTHASSFFASSCMRHRRRRLNGHDRVWHVL